MPGQDYCSLKMTRLRTCSDVCEKEGTEQWQYQHP